MMRLNRPSPDDPFGVLVVGQILLTLAIIPLVMGFLDKENRLLFIVVSIPVVPLIVGHTIAFIICLRGRRHE